MAGDIDLLPRGRHSLSREQVAGSQRRRLLRAMTDEVGERGYVGTSAARVYGRARVSSRAFYEQFNDKEHCFLAAYEAGVANFLKGIADDVGTTVPGGPLDRIERLLDRYLSALNEDRNFARAYLIEIYGVGPRALKRRASIHQRFVGLVAGVLTPGSAPRPLSDPDRFAVETLVAGVTFMVTSCVAINDFDGLLALRDPLVALVKRMIGSPTIAAEPL